ncbi:zeatin O-xylosyltransferase-like [Salvia miltiorrhiza]|uniref:zeatin O-xylosyltransferase-like n=1 Tax=Salvia miltiorrhiza TaxID=226208 RepID=UPI0025AD3D7D|nr:zeatin O-xylosyltransferase-like [Salvia miltiorrhiza]
MEEGKTQAAVLMVPLPCQSHLNQLLQLSGVIASCGIPVHYTGTATHNRQARLRSHGLKPNNATIKFHDLPTPPIDAPAPNPHAEDKTPMHLASATTAYAGLREQIGLLAQELSRKTVRLVVVYDRMGTEAVRDAVSVPNAESYSFNCLSAFNLFLILWEAMGKPFELRDAALFQKLPSVRDFMSEGALYFSASENIPEREGDIHNTIRLIDEAYIRLMSREEISGGKKQWAIRSSTAFNLERESSSHGCLRWLDQQATGSVIYVSFGTTTSLRDEEYAEIARGLEMSEQRFIWVVREADRADIFAGGSEVRRIELPEGFEERVRERGIIVRGWAPQMEILGHPSTGGFMSHCGWNSCLESLTAGVPMAAWPMHSDQPINATFVTEVLGIGLWVREWGRRLEVVGAAAVEDAVVRLMASEEGKVMRRRAAEVGATLRKSMEEGGESCMEIERFISHITR